MASALEVNFLAVITDVDGVSNGGVIENEKPLISGTAEPFSTVDVHDGTALLGVASANGQGGWTLQLSSPLFDGVHDLSATQATGYGVRSIASYFAVTVKATEVAHLSGESAATLANTAATSADNVEPGVPFFPRNLFTARRGSATLDGADADVVNPGNPQASTFSTY
jgi:hypothetical protein